MVTNIYELTFQCHSMTQLRSTDQNYQHENRINYSKIIKQNETDEKEFKSVLILMSHEREREKEKKRKKEREREKEKKKEIFPITTISLSHFRSLNLISTEVRH